jgi:hypothetical protein
VAEPNHDPHLIQSRPLPASVLIGLALLPFAIPILWLIAPVVTGVAPAMSIATPAALAVSASILCLAVIYTVDWTPATRIKGVLMLVGLAYFGAGSLYFLKREMVGRFQRFAGLEERIPWRPFGTADYKIELPGRVQALDENDRPIASLKLSYHTATSDQRLTGRYQFVCGSLRLGNQDGGNGNEPGTAAWFAGIVREVVDRSGGRRLGDPEELSHNANQLGRQFLIHFPDQQAFRLVRIYVIHQTVYYLSVEGSNVDSEDAIVIHFFDSFQPSVGRR